MTIKGLIAVLSQQEDLNFLLTNRVPRAALTRFMGWFSTVSYTHLTLPTNREV